MTALINTDFQPDPTETGLWMARKTPILWLFSLHSTFRSMIGTRSGSQERESGRGGGVEEVTRRRQRPSGRRDALRHVWRRCHEFIQINDSRPYTEGDEGLRAQSIHFMLENGENPEYAHINQLFSTFFSDNIRCADIKSDKQSILLHTDFMSCRSAWNA